MTKIIIVEPIEEQPAQVVVLLAPCLS